MDLMFFALAFPVKHFLLLAKEVDLKIQEAPCFLMLQKS
jgi:hypothetical protein